jgi:hypothetical protein
MMNRSLTRRDFLHVAGATALGLPLVPFGLRAGQSPRVLFGNKTDWDRAPMLGCAPWEEVERFGKEARALWSAFARSGEFPRPTAWLMPQG